MAAMMKVKLVRSPNGAKPKHRATVVGLGLRRMQHVRTIIDTAETRGMVKSVAHLVQIVEDGAQVSA